MLKPVSVMRGWPLVTRGACQCFDHSVSSSFLHPQWLDAPLTSFNVRLFSTCVNCPMYSSFRSSLVPVCAGWLVDAPGPKGSYVLCLESLPITRVCGDS